ncbi:calcium uniporter regulatory subunit MCUb, mitochondrial-like isoform X1 [Hypomesus transpacificus]|uniref:calcium uniporter regulatory subunit MCUb, mitochondrial-like isoform X1 n=1 Tax=Hypomesus transpacificus TaxID=137520 RepID=UPI001F0825E9|nr:calcium uniporter regulatory subunit MCUb, mitochondrial-like isoform X1 [Hypomesus transpacificus]
MVWFGKIARLHFAALRCCPPLYRTVSPLRSTARLWCLQASPVLYYSTLPPSADLRVDYKHGRPTLSLPLPSRQERCHFLLRPLLMSVDDFLSDIQKEDPGVTTAAVLTSEGGKVSSCTSMDTVLKQNFLLQLNSTVYTVHSAGGDSHEHVTMPEDLKELVLMLHCALQLPGHQLHTHNQLQQRRHTLTQELAPLEQVRAQLAREAESHASRVTWAGLAFLSLQGGFLAYLTWFVFAWDVMEPVTYFLTYATSMGFLGYYVLTKQDLIHPDAKDRQFLHFFYKRAAKKHFKVHQYNLLRKELAMVESDLKRLRNPLELKIPVDQIQAHN